MKRLSWFLCSSLLAVTAASGDSLWRADSDRSMFADRKAAAIGDLLTIIVQESSTAEKDNTTKTGKSTDINAALETFLYSPAASRFLTKKHELPALKAHASSAFDGGGTINNSEKIVAKVPVRVIDVLPNKNLVVEGRRHTSFSGEHQDVVLHGVVRQEDVAANNTVFSYNVADATIKFLNNGTVTDTQRKGWFTWLWDKLTPF